MTTQIINDPASLQRLGMLLESMDGRRSHLERVAQAHREAGNVHDAYAAQQSANHAAGVAYRVRCYMAAVEADQPPGLADVLAKLPDEKFSQIAPGADDPEREPPHQLVPFVAWLRLKLGRYLPWVPAHVWQAVGAALLGYRPTGGTR